MKRKRVREREREKEGESGLRARNQPWRPGAHNLPIGTLHYSCLQLQAANQPGPPVICLGQIQSQPCGGFELTINFKRVRRPFRQRSAQSIHQRGQATMFRRVSDRRCAKGINLLPAESGEEGIGGRIFMRGKAEWMKTSAKLEKERKPENALAISRLIRQRHGNRRSMIRCRLSVTFELNIMQRNTIRSRWRCIARAIFRKIESDYNPRDITIFTSSREKVAQYCRNFYCNIPRDVKR